MKISSIGSWSRKSNQPRTSVDVPDSYGVGGAMLPIFLRDLEENDRRDLVEVTLEIERNNSVYLRGVAPASTTANSPTVAERNLVKGFLTRSRSASSKLRRKFSWKRSPSTPTSNASSSEDEPPLPFSAREIGKIKLQLLREQSSAQKALKGLRFISKNIAGATSDAGQLWKKVESRFFVLAKDGLLCRENFGECIGTY